MVFYPYIALSLRSRYDLNSTFLHIFGHKDIFTITGKYLILTLVNKYVFFVKLVS